MINLDKLETDINCPECDFYNTISFKDIRLKNVIICRGCKLNMQLDDYMNSFKIQLRKIQSELDEINNIISDINNTTINLNF